MSTLDFICMILVSRKQSNHIELLVCSNEIENCRVLCPNHGNTKHTVVLGRSWTAISSQISKGAILESHMDTELSKILLVSLTVGGEFLRRPEAGDKTTERARPGGGVFKYSGETRMRRMEKACKKEFISRELGLTYNWWKKTCDFSSPFKCKLYDLVTKSLRKILMPIS